MPTGSLGGGGKRRQQLVHDTAAAADDASQSPGGSSSSSSGTTGKRHIADGVSRLDASLAAEMEKAQQMQSERRQPADADAHLSGLDSSSETIAGTPAGSAETGDEDVQSLTDKIHIHRSHPYTSWWHA